MSRLHVEVGCSGFDRWKLAPDLNWVIRLTLYSQDLASCSGLPVCFELVEWLEPAVPQVMGLQKLPEPILVGCPVLEGADLK